MKHLLLTLALLSPLAFAQNGPGGGQGGPGAGGPTAAQRAQFARFQPLFDLVQTVNLMTEVDKVRGLAFSKDQAKKLLVVLRDLQKRGDLKPADADKILETLETKLLSSKQLTKMDDILLERQEERRKRAQAAGAGQGGQGFRVPGVPGGGFGGGPRPGGQAGPDGPGGARGGMMQALMQGKPYNPFKEERSAKMLADTIALLAKK